MARRHVDLPSLPQRSRKGLVEKGRNIFYPHHHTQLQGKMPPHLMSTPKGDAQDPGSHHLTLRVLRLMLPPLTSLPPCRTPLPRHSLEWKGPRKFIQVALLLLRWVLLCLVSFCYPVLSPAAQPGERQGLIENRVLPLAFQLIREAW